MSCMCGQDVPQLCTQKQQPNTNTEPDALTPLWNTGSEKK